MTSKHRRSLDSSDLRMHTTLEPVAEEWPSVQAGEIAHAPTASARGSEADANEASGSRPGAASRPSASYRATTAHMDDWDGRPTEDERPTTRTARPAAQPRAGARIGQYEFIRSLGRGGMGEVFLARDLRLGRRVAIKRLSTPNDELARRFLREARTTAQCVHENIVVIHEVGEVAEAASADGWGEPYMVLEYIEGQTLRQWLRERASTAGEHAPVPPSRALELMLPVIRALAYAHERGIIHRDLKPENVMLTRAGTIKVLDFGIAKVLRASVLGDADDETGGPDGVVDAISGRVSGPLVTRSSGLIGTLPYMSPEQMNVGVIDHRSDLWTVGIMLFELVTGRHPVGTVLHYDGMTGRPGCPCGTIREGISMESGAHPRARPSLSPGTAASSTILASAPAAGLWLVTRRFGGGPGRLRLDPWGRAE
ncbi:serine/threonine protein kinase [Haliangium ochraceum DSM 14365]|uniref:Serine/threonine protein kinase n=1 Tax=Haliangium ochraceum (strain DSM 14365 / JCM 11303 / SMP-2) TaxID=502025 RepID=D0LW45_HALO1|nr:serine/threonine protein kinase [Haliangium ochraceum DSM 14365]